MRNNAYITLLILCIVLTGCDLISPKKKKATVQEKEPVINLVDDVQLAKLILQPQRYKLTIEKDPFLPIIDNRPAEIPNDEPTVEDVLANIEFLGVVKVSARYSALLNVEAKKGVFNINDTINQLTIVDIQDEQVVFKKGTETYILKRGD